MLRFLKIDFLLGLSVLFFISYSTISISAESKGISDISKEYSQDLAKLNMLPKKNKQILDAALAKINSDCCSENFEKKTKVLEIKNSIDNCIAEKCFENTYLFWIFEKPQKLIVLNQIDELDNLLLLNEKSKLFDEENKITKLEEEKNKLSNNYSELKKNYDSFKTKIEQLLVKYETKISNLEKENKDLAEKNNKIYSLLNGSQKKQLEK